MQVDPLPCRAPPGAWDPVDVSNAAEAAVELARGQGPLRRVLSALAGVWVARKGWEGCGHARLGDHAREQLGVSGRQLSELARTDEALRRLPEVERALVSGELSWTKARLLARIASVDDEAAWLARAHAATAGELSREVRRIDRRAVDGKRPRGALEPPERETLFLAFRGETRRKWYTAGQLASRLAGQRLRDDEVAEAVLGEVLSGLAPEILAGLPDETTAIRLGGADGCADRARGGGAALRAPGELPESIVGELPVFLCELLGGLADLGVRELEARLRRALRLEQSWLVRLGPLLLEVARGRLYRRYDCPSMAAFATEHLGMSPRSVQALLRIERACVVCPELEAAWREGRVSSEQALRLARLVAEHGGSLVTADWIEHAGRVPVLRLDDDVKRALATGITDPAAFDTRSSWDSPEPQTGANPGSERHRRRLFFTAPTEIARRFRAVQAAIQRAIEQREGRASDENEALSWMLDHAIESWRALGALHGRRHAVFERDGWRCTVPGCSAVAGLHDHHIRFRSAGGSDAPSNRTSLCWWHHQQGVHGGRVRCEGEAPDRLRFGLGIGRGSARSRGVDRAIRPPRV